MVTAFHVNPFTFLPADVTKYEDVTPIVKEDGESLMCHLTKIDGMGPIFQNSNSAKQLIGQLASQGRARIDIRIVVSTLFDNGAIFVHRVEQKIITTLFPVCQPKNV